MRRTALITVAAALMVTMSANAQTPSPSPPPEIALGWAVDTSASPAREIVRTVAAYYRLPDRGRAPTTLWAGDEQRRAGRYDLTPDWVYQPGFAATIGSVLPATPDSSLWLVRTLFASVDSATREVQPLALHRLYARPAPRTSGAPHGWQLSGALVHLTRGWSTRRSGSIVYHIAPGYAFQANRAATATRFLDTAARRIGVPVPARIDYYLTPSWEDSERLLGIDWAPNRVAWAGRAYPSERLVFAGHPGIGEAYTHELAHVLAGALPGAERRHRLVEEGLATWLGGGNRGPAAVYYALLSDYLRAHPEQTFADLVASFDRETEFYSTGALVVDAAYRREGIETLRRLAAVPDDGTALLDSISVLMDLRQTQIDQWWRREAIRAASSSPRQSPAPADTQSSAR